LASEPGSPWFGAVFSLLRLLCCLSGFQSFLEVRFGLLFRFCGEGALHFGDVPRTFGLQTGQIRLLPCFLLGFLGADGFVLGAFSL